MNNYFEQARALAENLLQSTEGKRYQEAKFIFESDDIAIEKLNEYEEFRKNFQIKLRSGKNATEIEQDRNTLNEMISNIKQDEVIFNLFKAEEDFNNLVKSVMDIFNLTLLGEENFSSNCCGGGCNGCTGCN